MRFGESTVQACQDLQSVLEASKQEKDQLRAELQTSQEQTAFASNEAEVSSLLL